MNIGVKFVLTLVALATGAFSFASCSSAQPVSGDQTSAESTLVTSDNLPENQATAVFAMGCFWCAEADFAKVDGVVDVISGYTGGSAINPTYEQVVYDDTGHYEAVLVTYDTTQISYSDLLSVFWMNVDPFDAAGQFCDVGTSYRAAIFPGNAAELEEATGTKEGWAEHFDRSIAAAIVDRSDFYAAEDYHQDYAEKNPTRYNRYRTGCRRDARLAEVWGETAG